MKSVILFLLVVGLFFNLTPVLAADVYMSVEVATKKSTDTINDFDFSTVNTTYEIGRVAGVSTATSVKSIKWCPVI